MNGKYENSKVLRHAKQNILNHNIETVRRLTPKIRACATYERFLEFLRNAKQMNPDIPTKSSIMVGLGETKEAIIETIGDLRANQEDIMTIGRYLEPTNCHLKVEKYGTPQEFNELKRIAISKGLSHCESGPLVRSSYYADEQVYAAKINVNV
jgi:lipoic acid synthetase